LVKGRDDFAKQFNVSMGDIVGGTFVQHFDKKGKPTTTDDTVLGVTYHEDQQHFAERIQADNYLAVLDKLGFAASAFVAGAQSDADKLMAAVQDMAAATQQAQQDIKQGASLLKNDNSIADVMTEVIKLDGANENLADAYKRLQAEQQAFTTDLDHVTLESGKSAQQILEFADAEAQAAGGASALAKLIDQFNKDFFTAG
jgi:nucleotide-binding universal stress UspA family protein